MFADAMYREFSVKMMNSDSILYIFCTGDVYSSSLFTSSFSPFSFTPIRTCCSRDAVQ